MLNENYKIAVLLDNLINNSQSNIILKEILSKPQYDVTIFTIVKEEMIPNLLPVFSMSEYFNWEGVSVITSDKTLEKSIAYPVVGPKIIVGNLKFKDYLNIKEFNLDLVGGVLNEYYKNKKD